MIALEDLVQGEVVTLGPTGASREQVLAFARAYDPQPFHLSDAAAAETYFGRLSASGWHTAAMILALITANDDWPLMCLGCREIRDLRWRRPVYPEDALTADVTVKTVETSNDQYGTATLAVGLRNQQADVVAELSLVLVVARRA